MNENELKASPDVFPAETARSESSVKQPWVIGVIEFNNEELKKKMLPANENHTVHFHEPDRRECVYVTDRHAKEMLDLFYVLLEVNHVSLFKRKGF